MHRESRLQVILSLVKLGRPNEGHQMHDVELVSGLVGIHQLFFFFFLRERPVLKRLKFEQFCTLFFFFGVKKTVCAHRWSNGESSRISNRVDGTILPGKSKGKVEGFSNGVNHMYSADKDGVVIGNNRKVQVLDVALDYDYAGPNPKHDPRGKKPGGGGNKNP